MPIPINAVPINRNGIFTIRSNDPIINKINTPANVRAIPNFWAIRGAIGEKIANISNGIVVKIPNELPLKLCGDNAAMIGAAGYVGYKHSVRAGLDLNADPSLEFDWINE